MDKDWIIKPEISVLIVMVILCAIFQMANPMFLSWNNIATMLRAVAFPGIIAIGMTITLMSGAIDLSVGAIAGFAACLSSFLMMRMGWDIVPALFVAIVTSALIGAINCFTIFKLNIIALIATIGMMYVLRGLSNFITNGMSIYPIPDELVRLGESQPLGISWPFLFFVGNAIVLEVMLRNTVWGLEVRATGSDRIVAKDTEVRVDLVNFTTFILLGALSGIAGIFAMARISAGDPVLGMGWEFQAILACAIGGVSLFGYTGSISGMFLGLLTMQIISTGLVEIGVSPYLQSSFMGILLIAALALDVRKRKYFNPEEKD